ncbi:MAG: GxxExxY protein [Kofleriaceae bacterium]
MTTNAVDLPESDRRLDALCFKVIGACIEVHRALGCGFHTRIYHTAIEHELVHRNIAFQTQLPFEVKYRGHIVGEFRVDLVVEDELLVELKTIPQINTHHVTQTLSYLHNLDLELGLILNFSRPALRDGGIRRVSRTRGT